MSRMRWARLENLADVFWEKGGQKVPCRQLCSHIVGGAYQSCFCERTTEDHELSETYWSGFFAYPSEDIISTVLPKFW